MQTIKCKNCDCEINSSIMFLHERCCSSNIRKCSICNEPIQVDEYKEHKNFVHGDKKCEFCQKKFPEEEYNSHLSKCPNKLYSCKYCGLFLTKQELSNHEYECGCRTLVCEFCSENIPENEYDLHLEFTCKVKQKSNKAKIKQNINDKNNLMEDEKEKFIEIKKIKENLIDNRENFLDINNVDEKKINEIMEIKGKKNKDKDIMKIKFSKRKRENDDEWEVKNKKKKKY